MPSDSRSRSQGFANAKAARTRRLIPPNPEKGLIFVGRRPATFKIPLPHASTARAFPGLR